MIQRLEAWDFPQTNMVPDGYDMTCIPVVSQENLQVIIDKQNEIIDTLNLITGSPLG